MKLGVLLDQYPVLDRQNWNPKKNILKITSDSRLVEPGDLFIATDGCMMNGHDFIGQAVQAKAAAIIYEREPTTLLPTKTPVIQVRNSREALASLMNRFYGYPDRDVKLIGVTGTNGKTTVSYLLHRLLREKTPAAYVGTLWYEYSDRKLPAVNTTPSSEVLIPLLRDMASENVGHCIMEVSSHALEQRRTHGLSFELAMFTQLTQDHLDYHQDMESYFAAKRMLFERNPLPRNILTNFDCPYGRRILSGKREAKSFGLQGYGDFQAVNIESSFQGSRFDLSYKNRSIPFQIRLPLKHNVSNVLAALSALAMLGYDPEEFRAILQEIPGIPGRMERVMGSDDFQVFVDYAHTPDAIENVLLQAKLLKPKRVLSLIGCGGDRDRSKRPLMAQAAARHSDIIVLTSDNPRSEDPEVILEEVRQGIPSGFQRNGSVHTVLDRAEAIQKILSVAEPGDAVFILGKGHENYQILGERKIPFDDREVVQECLKRKKRVFFS